MKIEFLLAWHKPGKSLSQAFKNAASSSLVSEYTKRISKFSPCGISGSILQSVRREPSDVFWFCDRGRGSQMLSSESLADCLRNVQNTGSAKNLKIVIGGPDGFSDEVINTLKPDLRWCFGPMTLPHEIATVVASEQIYRAFTILRGTPYHLGH